MTSGAEELTSHREGTGEVLDTGNIPCLKLVVGTGVTSDL